MAYGEVYVEVDASVIGGGIMPMATISGGRPESVAGGETFGAWLLWQYEDTTGEGGFTGVSWYFDDEYNAINKKYKTEEEFKEYLVNNKPGDLNTVLGDWNSTDKGLFYTKYQDELGDKGCFLFVSGS